MNNRFWMIGILIIMAVVCSTTLAVVNRITSPIIAKQNEIKSMSTVLDVFTIPYETLESDDLIATYKQSIEEYEVNGLKLFREQESGHTAISITGSGFKGSITVIVALDNDIISGFRVVDQVETPGLGARITEKRFQNSFIGKKVSEGITMVRSGAAGENEFDAITGATETSRALEQILNRGFEQYSGIKNEKL